MSVRDIAALPDLWAARVIQLRLEAWGRKPTSGSRSEAPASQRTAAPSWPQRSREGLPDPW